MAKTIELPNIQDFTTQSAFLAQCLTCHLLGKSTVSISEQKIYEIAREHLTEFPGHQVVISTVVHMTKKP